MRLMIAALAALWMVAPASASFTTDDRYFDSRAPVAQQKVKASRSIHRKARVVRHHFRTKKVTRATSRITTPEHKHPVTDAGWGRTTIATPRETIQYTPQSDPEPITFSGPRPRAWCGWWLGRHLGMLARNLWLARNWAHVGSPSSKHVGAIVVWRHHVGKITAVRSDGAIKVLSGNDGRAVRDRWRSARGVIAYRAL